MAAATKEWIRVAWRNDNRKGQMSKVEATVLFDKGSAIIGRERYTERKKGWKKMKNILNTGQKRNKQQSLAEKELQSEIPK